MSTSTAPADVSISTAYNITPQLPTTPLHEEISEEFGTFFYICLSIGCIWITLYLCNCLYKSHKYHQGDGLPQHERLQKI